MITPDITPDDAFEYTAGGQYIERQVSVDIALDLPTFSPGFEWNPDYYQVVATVAATNRVEDWPLLKDIMKYKLSESIKSYLSNGPVNTISTTEAFDVQTRACASFDEFKSHPPFTIQRLAELIDHPRQHYSSLPKYLRALTRAISVTSDQTAFTEDSSTNLYASTSTASLDDPSIAGMGLNPNSNSIHTPTKRPINSIKSRSNSISSTILPLLSPIPWLVTTIENPFSPTTLPTELPIHSPSPAENGSHSHSHSLTSTPTGGVIDELDLGTGTTELANEPVIIQNLNHQDSNSSPSSITAGEGADGMDVGSAGSSLKERFERARSPRAEQEEGAMNTFGLEP